MTDPDLDRIFKAYDVRGVVPDELDASIARRIGAAFAVWTNLPAILLVQTTIPSAHAKRIVAKTGAEVVLWDSKQSARACIEEAWGFRRLVGPRWR